MITASEKGRKLIITVGAGDDDAIVITVPPVSSSVGTALFALWAGVLFAQSEQPLDDATNLSKLAVGEDNWDAVQELRSSEAELVVNAAFFWNTQGGGIELVNELLRDGFPKARATLAETNGFGDALSQLQTLLDGGLANQTRELDDTPDTDIQLGI